MTQKDTDWKKFMEAQGRWLEHRMKVHKGEQGDSCKHKEQKEVDDAATTYLLAAREKTP